MKTQEYNHSKKKTSKATGVDIDDCQKRLSKAMKKLKKKAKKEGFNISISRASELFETTFTPRELAVISTMKSHQVKALECQLQKMALIEALTSLADGLDDIVNDTVKDTDSSEKLMQDEDDVVAKTAETIAD